MWLVLMLSSLLRRGQTLFTASFCLCHCPPSLPTCSLSAFFFVFLYFSSSSLLSCMVLALSKAAPLTGTTNAPAQAPRFTPFFTKPSDPLLFTYVHLFEAREARPRRSRCARTLFLSISSFASLIPRRTYHTYQLPLLCSRVLLMPPPPPSRSSFRTLSRILVDATIREWQK